MIAFLLICYLAILFILVKFKVIQLTLWWKLSPVVWTVLHVALSPFGGGERARKLSKEPPSTLAAQQLPCFFSRHHILVVNYSGAALTRERSVPHKRSGRLA